MSGNFSRLVYDENFMNNSMHQSTISGNYNLYTGQTNNSESCHALDGPRNNRTRNTSEVIIGGNAGVRTTVENNLQNRDEPANRSGTLLGSKNSKLNGITNLTKNNAYCKPQINSTYSRLETSIDNYRGLTTYGYQLDYPIIDPRESVFYGHNDTTLVNQHTNSRFGKNTNLEAKDEHTKKFN
tara:strand:- start:139 stop:687 length:549 start_codon:yes stop_codon:yes gene_type:complete